MNITFFDVTNMDYTPDTPLTQPLGGSQSALCYLAIALTGRGHTVSLINPTTSPGVYSGVRTPGMTREGMQCLQTSDVVVVLNGGAGHTIRKQNNLKCPLVLWTQHAPNQPGIRYLENAQERDSWESFAFVSQWALDNYVQIFGVDAARSRVLHNAIAPPFTRQEPATPWFETSDAPVLAYTSTPFRGLDVLLESFPAIRAAIPEATLRVYSSMTVYGANAGDAAYAALYERCRETPGVEYIGAVDQARLARDMSGVAALAYPSTFSETFCIAAAEAMSTGALLLTTKYGALPELYGAFALMIDRDPDPQKLARAYSAHVIDALDAARRDPAGAAARRRQQIDFIKATYTWPVLVQHWEAYLTGIVSGR